MQKSARPARRSAAVPVRDRRAGFNLVWTAVAFTVGATLFAATLPKSRSDIQKAGATVQKLSRVEKALTAFMAANGRLPCPADGQYAVNTANFGVEAANPGTCTGGTPAAPLGPDAGTGHVVGGVIPTKALHLDDDYAFDSWGRHITYLVDLRATQAASCLTLGNYPTNNGTGGITIESSTGGTVLDHVMHAFIIHGPDGHGAFPAAGSSVAGRINTGVIDQDKNTNAGVSNDGSFTYSSTNFTNVKVMRTPTSSSPFKDIVYYAPYQKNVCCTGPICSSGCSLSANEGGGTLSNPGSMTAYQNNSDATCTGHTLSCSGSPSTLYCDGSTTLTNCTYNACNKYCGLTANQGGGTLLSGAPGLTEYASTSDASCTSHTLTCNNGTLYCDGTTDTTNCQYNSCSLACSLSGNQGGGTLTSGNTKTEYTSSSDASCTPHTLTCTNGSLSCSTGNMADCTYASCNLDCGLTTNQGGGVLLSGNTATEYTSQSDTSCTSHTLTCTNGTLSCNTGNSADCTYNSCSLACSLSANQGGGTLTSGNTKTEFTSSSGASCPSHTLTCTNGSLSCSTGTSSDCSYSSCTVSSNNGFRLDGEAANYQTGGGVAIGDVNGDGIKDLIISAPFTSPGGVSYAGSVYVVFGTSTGFPDPLPLSTLNGTNGFRLDGGAHDEIGSVASGDFNGDGVSDIIIGASTASYNGLSLSGSVFVVYGGSKMKNGTAWSSCPCSLTAGGSVINGTNGFRLDGVAASDQAGGSPALGDVNGDGYADLVVGAAGTTNGEVYVVFGGPTMKSGSAWPTTQSLGTVANGTNGASFTGGVTVVSGNKLGATNAVGDINGDGYGDLLLGESGYNSYCTTHGCVASNSGAVLVIYGKASGWSSSTTLKSGTAPLNGTNGFILTGSTATEGTGGHVAAGDVDGRTNGGHPIDDILTAYDTYGPERMAVVFGGTGGKMKDGTTAWAASNDLTPGGAVVNGTNGIELDGTSNDSGEWSLATGDIDKDGYNDIVIGVQLAQDNGLLNSGATYVIFGGPTMKSGGAWSSTQSLSTLADGTNGFRLDGAAAGDYAGYGSAVGDVNGDGYADVLIGADSASPSEGSKAGEVYVYFGKSSGWPNPNASLSTLCTGAGC